MFRIVAALIKLVRGGFKQAPPITVTLNLAVSPKSDVGQATDVLRETAVTEAPFARVSSMIRSFSSIVCRMRGPVRRPSESVVTISSAKVPTLPLRGHLRCAHLAHHGYAALR
jgi:hypothetical protein